MHFSTVLSTTLLSLFALSQASPLQSRQTIDPPARYYLQTEVIEDPEHKDHGTNKTHLWLYSYHTGAGLGDAGLSSNKSWAWEGYLNGSQQLFTYENNQIGPWPLAIGYGPYQREQYPSREDCRSRLTLACRVESGHH